MSFSPQELANIGFATVTGIVVVRYVWNYLNRRTIHPVREVATIAYLVGAACFMFSAYLSITFGASLGGSGTTAIIGMMVLAIAQVSEKIGAGLFSLGVTKEKRAVWCTTGAALFLFGMTLSIYAVSASWKGVADAKQAELLAQSDAYKTALQRRENAVNQADRLYVSNDEYKNSLQAKSGAEASLAPIMGAGNAYVANWHTCLPKTNSRGEPYTQRAAKACEEARPYMEIISQAEQVERDYKHYLNAKAKADDLLATALPSAGAEGSQLTHIALLSSAFGISYEKASFVWPILLSTIIELFIIIGAVVYAILKHTHPEAFEDTVSSGAAMPMEHSTQASLPIVARVMEAGTKLANALPSLPSKAVPVTAEAPNDYLVGPAYQSPKMQPNQTAIVAKASQGFNMQVDLSAVNMPTVTGVGVETSYPSRPFGFIPEKPLVMTAKIGCLVKFASDNGTVSGLVVALNSERTKGIARLDNGDFVEFQQANLTSCKPPALDEGKVYNFKGGPVKLGTEMVLIDFPKAWDAEYPIVKVEGGTAVKSAALKAGEMSVCLHCGTAYRKSRVDQRFDTKPCKATHHNTKLDN
jgi:hypothetical protein